MMAYPSSFSCGAGIQDTVVRSCPSGNGRPLSIRGQDCPEAPVAGRFRNIPDGMTAAGAVLFLIMTAILVHALILHPVAAPGAENASISPSPAPVPEGTVTAAAVPSGPLQGTLPAGPDRARNTTGPEALPDQARAPATGGGRVVPVINATSLAMRIHERVNRVRQEHGLSALGTDAALASLARAHSTDMASHGYFGHINLDERDATARGAAAGYTCHKNADPYFTYAIAENLYATYRYSSVFLVDGRAATVAWTSEESIAEEAVDAWMESPDHRDNVLDPDMGREGIGIAFGQDDMVFVTQDFC